MNLVWFHFITADVPSNKMDRKYFFDVISYQNELTDDYYEIPL